MTLSAANKNVPVSSPASGDGQPAGTKVHFELRRKKVLEYADQALNKSNSLVGNLELVNTDLMQMLLWLREDTENLRAQESNPVERLELMIPISEHVYKLAKQLHILSDFLRHIQQPASDAPTQKKVVRLSEPKQPR